jgi:mono/diheme cytochrome c family protein
LNKKYFPQFVTRSSPATPKFWVLVMLAVLLMVTGCTEIGNMKDQPKIRDPFGPSTNFEVGAPELDPNAVPVGFLREDTHLYEGRVDGTFATTFPIEITEDVLHEGQRLYNGVCAACHGEAGYGQGVLAQEGLVAPSLHTESSRNAPVGVFYLIITQGRGAMYNQAYTLDPEERWAVIAYIRALQLAEYAEIEALPSDVQSSFMSAVTAGETMTDADTAEMTNFGAPDADAADGGEAMDGDMMGNEGE